MCTTYNHSTSKYDVFVRCRKLKIDRKAAHDTGYQCSYLEIEWSKVKVTRPAANDHEVTVHGQPFTEFDE